MMCRRYVAEGSHKEWNDMTVVGEKIWACIVMSLACLTVGSGICDIGFTSAVEMLGVPILLAGRYSGWERYPP
jgi:hypothetical protein